MAPERMTFRRLPLAFALAASCAVIIPAPAHAQDADARLRKVESELRALQRAVFPGGDGRYFTPEVDTSQAATPTPGAPTTTPVSDILVRLDTIEAQLARITANSEESVNTIADLKARLAALEVADTDAVNPQAAVGGAVRTTAPVIAAAPTPTPAAAIAPPPAVSTPAVSGPSAARVAGVTAILKPDTGDAGADDYTYGYRLWEAKFFPEAQQQLRKYVDTYPKHAQISLGRNLLGRAFLDAGDARAAATWFLQNYQADKNGSRAGDSLLYLAEAMISMKDTNRACIALAEFGDTYPALATGRLKAQYERNRANVTCK
jgi:TolA-binding protein